MSVTGPSWWKVNIGSGNGLLLSGITLTSVDQDLQRHMASIGPNELTMQQHWSVPVKYNNFITEMFP